MGFIKWLGRVCLSVTFILGGYEAFNEPATRKVRLPNIGLQESELAVKVNGGAMVVGGFALALGIFPRLTALALMTALIPTTLAGHPFWKESEQKAMKQQRIQFAKNLGLMGGLLWVLAETRPPESKAE